MPRTETKAEQKLNRKKKNCNIHLCKINLVVENMNINSPKEKFCR